MERTARQVTRAERVRQRRRKTAPRAKPARRARRGRRVAASAVPDLVATPMMVDRHGVAGQVALPSTFPLPEQEGRDWALPRLTWGWRWVSALVLLLSLAGLYALFTLPAFAVQRVEIRGLERMSERSLRGVLPLDAPAVTVDPQTTAQLLLTTFPGLAEAQVSLDFKGVLRVQVVERQPVLAWNFQGARWWVDPEGVLFPALGSETLPEVQVEDLPPGLAQVQGQWRLPKDLVQALQVLAAYVPQGQPLVYDARYGLGWEAPEGWRVFVGRQPTRMAARMRLYWALREHLRGRGLRPAIIDLSSLDAPYYRMEP